MHCSLLGALGVSDFCFLVLDRDSENVSFTGWGNLGHFCTAHHLLFGICDTGKGPRPSNRVSFDGHEESLQWSPLV